MGEMNIKQTLAPNSQEAEQAVLGAVIIAPEIFSQIRAMLQADDFFYLPHRYLWQAISALHDRGEAIDHLTIAEELRGMREKGDTETALSKIGGASQLTYLANCAPNSLNASSYATIVQKLSSRRKGTALATRIAQLCAAEDQAFDDALTAIQREYLRFITSVSGAGVVSGRDVASRVLDTFQANYENKASVRGLHCDLSDLNTALGGFRPGLFSVGGAASMGKSTFAANLAGAFSRQAPGLYVPTEMTPDRALARMLCDIAGIQYKTWLSGYVSEEQVGAFVDAMDCIKADNITFLEGKAISPARIQAECARIGAQWCIVDSASVLSNRQIGKFKGDARVATNYVSAALQDIGASVPVIALWQTGRNAKDRKDKRPTINDFKESGNIEEDADVCMALYRHEYYTQRRLADPDPLEFPKGTANIYVLKDRDGGDGNGKVTVEFVPGQGLKDYRGRR